VSLAARGLRSLRVEAGNAMRGELQPKRVLLSCGRNMPPHNRYMFGRGSSMPPNNRNRCGRRYARPGVVLDGSLADCGGRKIGLSREDPGMRAGGERGRRKHKGPKNERDGAG